MVVATRTRIACVVMAAALAGGGGLCVIAQDHPSEATNAQAPKVRATGKPTTAGRLRIIDKDSNGNSSPDVSAFLQALIAQVQSGELPKPRPALVEAFDPFKDQVKYHWDEKWLYVESSGLPAHNMMVGITAWQQQVPLPKAYVGDNAWQIPLHPVVSKNPVSIKGRFLRGAIAVAVNGIPIFNPQNNRGEVSAEIGELDQWGGHCGRGDDYHYHVAPIHLEKIVGPGKPIAFALDGYPIYGSTGPDGQPVDEKTLDAFRGKTDANGNYAYYASSKYPFLEESRPSGGGDKGSDRPGREGPPRDSN